MSVCDAVSSDELASIPDEDVAVNGFLGCRRLLFASSMGSKESSNSRKFCVPRLPRLLRGATDLIDGVNPNEFLDRGPSSRVSVLGEHPIARESNCPT